MSKNISVIVPTCNGGKVWEEAASQLSLLKNEDISIVTIDSESVDSTIKTSNKYGFDVLGIRRLDFNHGGTRNIAARYCIDTFRAELIVFLTQDAILQSPKEFIDAITKKFVDDATLSAIYGKQLPHDDATSIARHARYYNYKNTPYQARPDNFKMMGLKAVFLSNSFAVYDVKIFTLLGGFPENTILCEDMYYAANSIQNGYAIGYCPDVAVKHSHNYTPCGEFKRYFDIGVFHACEPWIGKMFGGATREGKKFLISEFKYLAKYNPQSIITACINNIMKIVGYKLGKSHKKLSLRICKEFSMHKSYWASRIK